MSLVEGDREGDRKIMNTGREGGREVKTEREFKSDKSVHTK